ncbi:short chain dehydrogenase [Nitratireductor indicus C115]|uniref:Short chain dehydrogenase n=1 Tax=Nitratireductor indicus C115 TaxID=1231190 RepID=K2PG18_9HYPH|nr:SDR family oxidoreductase [Nitratireductor indicus]EKF39972.1 short chain dehydrogenase [Nitratireductor indicus C115]SFQ81744.1 NAD(P)-dependent dehydrogenase, short-chain alcohol dehydrogenase family [Nitratireductor indicus]
MDLRMAGKTALITGASQGIGEGLARTLAEEGVNLHLTARSADRLEELRREIVSKNDVEVHLHPMDITGKGSCERLVEAAGDIDILVNNAGVIPSGTMYDVDEDAWRAGWELKVFGYINLCRLVYARLKARGGGVIINNIGNGGEVFDPRYIAGVTGNASLMAFTKALGGASLDDNIRVVGVNPGPVDTGRIYNMLKKRAKSMYGDESRYMELAATYPLGRPAHVEEVVDTIVFLASDRSGYTTGTVVTVDGGIASRRSII